MRNFVFALCCVVGSTVIAGDKECSERCLEPHPDPEFSVMVYSSVCCGPRVRRFHCIAPCDIFRATGDYMYNTTSGIVHGIGSAIAAPFKTPVCLPEPRTYEYRRPRWYYRPGFYRRIR